MSSEKVLIGNVGPYIRARKEFRMSSTLRGTYMYVIDHRHVYVILSFDTPIAIYIPATKTWAFNPAQYSLTSDKHLKIVSEWVDREEANNWIAEYDMFIGIQSNLRIHAFHPNTRQGNRSLFSTIELGL